ncbi:MAG: hypothetical protein HY925_14545, partial [Elusimicrobia bacterium]|nr:hypothetical protein [Elusimicrobiota bacterium]
PPAMKSMLLRATVRPSLVAVWGTWVELDSRFTGLNAAPGRAIKVHGVQFLGPAPASRSGDDSQELLGE